MNMHKVLVTGASGFIGSHLCKKLASTGKIVIAQVRDVFPSPWGIWLKEALDKCIQVRGDITNFSFLKRVVSEYEVDSCFHLAAQAVVKVGLMNPSETFKVNVLGTAVLLEVCRQLDVPTVYIQSTDKAYGERMDAKEEDPLVSTGIYETSKAMQDLLSQSYMNTYGLNIIIGRSCNVYGFDAASRIVSNSIRSCLNGNPPIIYEGEKTKRQYIYIEDEVSAIQLLTKTQKNGIWNIATDDILTQEQVVRKICSFFPLTPKLVKRDKPLKEIQKQSVNWDKLKALGWKPKFTFEEGIQETIKKFERYGFDSAK